MRLSKHNNTGARQLCRKIGLGERHRVQAQRAELWFVPLRGWDGAQKTGGFDLLKEDRGEACVACHAACAGGRSNWRCKQFESITEDRCSGGAVG